MTPAQLKARQEAMRARVEAREAAAKERTNARLRAAQIGEQRKYRPALTKVCPCGVTFVTTNPRVRWHSNECRRANGTFMPKAKGSMRYVRGSMRHERIGHAIAKKAMAQPWHDALKAQGWKCLKCGADLTPRNQVRAEADGQLVAVCRSCKRQPLTAVTPKHEPLKPKIVTRAERRKSAEETS